MQKGMCQVKQDSWLSQQTECYGSNTGGGHAHAQKVTSITVKPVLSGHPKRDKTKVLKTYGSLMKVESIAKCFLQYF